MSKEKKFVEKLKSDPTYFFKKVLGVKTLEDFQIKKMLEPVVKYSRVAIAATHSVGKTWTMARIALWFLFSYKNSKVITTAPTWRQVVKLLWGEIATAYTLSEYPLGGKLINNELTISPSWYALGFSPQKEAASTENGQKGSTFQGFHADYVLIIFDEATGIPADIWKMAEGLLTSGVIVKWVAIANPTTRACEFFKCFSDYEWHCETITCFDSPNLIANGITDIHKLQAEIDLLNEMGKDDSLLRVEKYKKPVPHLLSAQWVVSRARKWGIKHPLFQSKALGQFPDVDENVIVQLSDVNAAIERDTELDNSAIRCIGVDVARYGEDTTVFTELVGVKQTRKKTLVKRSVTEVSGEVISFIDSNKVYTKVLIDATGIGAGVFDILNDHYRTNHDVEIIEVHFGQGAGDEDDKKRYFNLKAKMFDLLGRDIKEKLDIIDDESYLLELPTILFSYNAKGQMIIESKDDYKKRNGGKSPDNADSLALANYGRSLKRVYGIFGDAKQGGFLTKADKLDDTKERISKRIKANDY